MKFEGPTPETETRQVSVSFATFIVAAAFVLFGLAMAMGTITNYRSPESAAPETIAPEPGVESLPAPLPAVTEPEPGTVPEAEPLETAEEGAASEALVQPVAEPVQPQPVAAAPAAPANGGATASDVPAESHDASFPTRRVAPPAPAAAAANPAVALPNRRQ